MPETPETRLKLDLIIELLSRIAKAVETLARRS